MHNSIALRLKHLLVGTSLGKFLETAREGATLWAALRSAPEKGGRVFQDRCGKILVASLCETDRVFLDVGAHIGSVISNVLHRQPDLAVEAIEADPEKAEWLRRKFPTIKIHSCAVGNSQGMTEFHINLDRAGFSSINSNPAHSVDKLRTVRVPIKRLDDIYCGKKLVGLIKIDVEGMELAVLQGGELLISRSRPVIYFESGPRGEVTIDTYTQELFKWLAEHEYHILVPNRIAHDAPPLHLQSFLESHYYPQRTLNYFAVPAERRLEIRDNARKILSMQTP